VTPPTIERDVGADGVRRRGHLPSSMLPYGILAAAGALVAVSSALAAVGFRSAEHSASRAASCGSVFVPTDTWGDCIRNRNAMARVVVLLALLALLLAIVAAVTARRRGATRTVARRSARTMAVVTTLVALGCSAVILLTPAGNSRCGATVSHLTTPPSDSFGNADSGCIDSYQKRWLIGGVGAVIMAAAGAVVAASRPSSRTSRWLAAGIAATLTASIVVLGITAIGWLWLAKRGGR
jgi:cytochrome bd-type quinol oxidase subunit 2